ncbi:hypothetical protein GALMADRAFT_210640 [Galerina marginata CBS 339.88]|uniref:Uncharacterized protein n=1 Tax=Galerina marginata (strain CBS 339.88) TaxID=685588 RepID=A0A067T352_GALM3|nr:hypothetical protein GALMADRAFT_210640 [Galerina marginata CBS 339.88]
MVQETIGHAGFGKLKASRVWMVHQNNFSLGTLEQRSELTFLFYHLTYLRTTQFKNAIRHCFQWILLLSKQIDFGAETKIVALEDTLKKYLFGRGNKSQFFLTPSFLRDLKLPAEEAKRLCAELADLRLKKAQNENEENARKLMGAGAGNSMRMILPAPGDKNAQPGPIGTAAGLEPVNHFAEAGAVIGAKSGQDEASQGRSVNEATGVEPESLSCKQTVEGEVTTDATHNELGSPGAPEIIQAQIIDPISVKAGLAVQAPFTGPQQASPSDVLQPLQGGQVKIVAGAAPDNVVLNALPTPTQLEGNAVARPPSSSRDEDKMESKGDDETTTKLSHTASKYDVPGAIDPVSQSFREISTSQGLSYATQDRPLVTGNMHTSQPFSAYSTLFLGNGDINSKGSDQRRPQKHQEHGIKTAQKPEAGAYISNANSQGSGTHSASVTMSADIGQLNYYAQDIEATIQSSQRNAIEPLGSSGSRLLMGPEYAAGQAHAADITQLQKLTQQIKSDLNGQISDNAKRPQEIEAKEPKMSFASRTMASCVENALKLTSTELSALDDKSEGDLTNSSYGPTGGQTQSFYSSISSQTREIMHHSLSQQPTDEGSYGPAGGQLTGLWNQDNWENSLNGQTPQIIPDGLCQQANDDSSHGPALGQRAELGNKGELANSGPYGQTAQDTLVALHPQPAVDSRPAGDPLGKANVGWLPGARKSNDTYIIPFEPANVANLQTQYTFPEHDPYFIASIPGSLPEEYTSPQCLDVDADPTGEANFVNPGASQSSLDIFNNLFDVADILMQAAGSSDGPSDGPSGGFLGQSPATSTAVAAFQESNDMDCAAEPRSESNISESKSVQKTRKEVQHREFALQNLQNELALEERKLSNLKDLFRDGSMTFDQARGPIEQKEREVNLLQTDVAQAVAESASASKNLLAVCDKAELDDLVQQISGLKGVLSSNPGYPFDVMAHIQLDMKKKSVRVQELQARCKPSEGEVGDDNSEEEVAERSRAKGKSKVVPTKRAKAEDPNPKGKKVTSKRVKREAPSSSQPGIPKKRTDKQRLSDIAKIVSTWLETESPTLTRIVSEDLSLPELSEDDVRYAEQEGRRQIAEFLEKGNPNVVNATVRKWCINFPGYLPECATATRELAILVHTSGQSNTRCRHHATHRNIKWKGTYDGNGPNIVEGVTYPPDLGSGEAHPKHFNCGCPIDAVLVDFFFWKTARACSFSNPNRMESMRQDATPPRIRAFVNSAFAMYAMLTVEGIYIKKVATEDEVVDNVQMKLVWNLVRRLNAKGWQINLIQGQRQSVESEDGMMEMCED